MTTAGKMDVRIIIQQPIQVEDEYGGQPIIDWQELKTVWAHVRPGRSRESVEQNQMQSFYTIEVTIRNALMFEAVDLPDCRVVYKGKTYKITEEIPARITQQFITFSADRETGDK